MSIITHKPQTTRHRILGILSDENSQIVFSDTPGVIDDPNYKMQEAMNDAAYSIFDDADLILFVLEPGQEYQDEERLIVQMKKASCPKFLIINKVDTSQPQILLDLKAQWEKRITFDQVHLISALNRIGTDHLLQSIRDILPEGPVYYPKDQISDKSERFFICEIIREKILIQFEQEIPYSCEVVIEEFKDSKKDGKPFSRIRANILVMRKSQKQILIGKNGAAIKKLGIESRKSIERFLSRRVHLELYVKIKEKWRDDDRLLRSFGYLH